MRSVGVFPAAVLLLLALSSSAIAQTGDDPCGAGVVSSPGVTADDGVMTGTAGPDVIVGTAAAETLRGLDGNDTICGRGGFDTISGGAGDDHLDAGTPATGNALDFAGAPTGVQVDLRLAGPQVTGHGTDTLKGFTRILGTDHADVLRGRDDNAGQEYIAGRGGTDRLYGGNGWDWLAGGDGDDWLDGGGGPDRLTGGDAETGVDIGGHDVASYAPRTGNVVVTIDGRANDGHPTTDDNPSDDMYRGADNVGFDVEDVVGGDGLDQLTGSAGANMLRGRGGNDLLRGLGGPDVLSGGDGLEDRVTYRERDAGVRAGIGGATADDGNADDGPEGARDQIWRDVERLDGTAYGDRLTGSSVRNEFFGFEGNDTLLGYAGNDELVGGPGNDYVSGGDDTDWVYGDAGHDRLFGDGGNDYLYGHKAAPDPDGTLDCGDGVDHTYWDREDPAPVGCERQTLS